MAKRKIGHPSNFTVQQNRALRAALASLMGRFETQTRLAVAIGITQKNTSRLLIDKNSGFSYATASAVARLLGFQGVDAFFASKGLGIGVGSFRSSSLITAVLGSTGIIGSATLILFLLHVFKPGRMSTYVSRRNPVEDVGAAAGWTVIMSLVPLGVSWPTADPGYVFGIFCGIALALRAAPARVRSSRDLAPPAGTRPLAFEAAT